MEEITNEGTKTKTIHLVVEEYLFNELKQLISPTCPTISYALRMIVVEHLKNLNSNLNDSISETEINISDYAIEQIVAGVIDGLRQSPQLESLDIDYPHKIRREPEIESSAAVGDSFKRTSEDEHFLNLARRAKRFKNAGLDYNKELEQYFDRI